VDQFFNVRAHGLGLAEELGRREGRLLY
jgi:hypothetical protein